MTDPIQTRVSLWNRASTLACEAQVIDSEIEKMESIIAAKRKQAAEYRHDAVGLRSAAERLQIIDEGGEKK